MDTITLGAFARSGNHYFQHLVKTALIDVRCDWLSHRISDWDGKENRVCIVRHPIDCVTSWISTTADTREDRAAKVLEWYTAYHQTVVSKKILVVKFDRLVKEPLASINSVCERFGINKSFFSYNTTLSAAMETDEDFIWANTDQSDYAKIKEEICSNASYPDAVRLFEALCDQSG